MRGMTLVVCLLVGLVPHGLAAQASAGDRTSAGNEAPDASDDDRSRRWSVQVAAGATVPHGDERGGDVESVSIGYAPTPKLTILVNGTRTHRPTHVQYFPDGVTSATRGGTVQFVSGEVRFTPRSDERVSPYAMAGAGLGVSRPNVNDIFPNRVTNAAYVWFSGGGLAVPLGPHLRVFGDVSALLLGERDVIRLILPLRAGLAWRF
jgi:hypothetical protein